MKKDTLRGVMVMKIRLDMVADIAANLVPQDGKVHPIRLESEGDRVGALYVDGVFRALINLEDGDILCEGDSFDMDEYLGICFPWVLTKEEIQFITAIKELS